MSKIAIFFLLCIISLSFEKKLKPWKKVELKLEDELEDLVESKISPLKVELDDKTVESLKPEVPESNFDIILNEKIRYTNSITVTSRDFIEIPHYTREIVTDKDYKLLMIKLNIPFTANQDRDSRSRILLYLDNEMLGDFTMHNSDI